VNNTVDNRREMRITACFLWIPSWIAENKKWLAAGSCAVFAAVVIMLSPLETGTTRGQGDFKIANRSHAVTRRNRVLGSPMCGASRLAP